MSGVEGMGTPGIIGICEGGRRRRGSLPHHFGIIRSEPVRDERPPKVVKLHVT